MKLTFCEAAKWNLHLIIWNMTFVQCDTIFFIHHLGMQIVLHWKTASTNWCCEREAEQKKNRFFYLRIFPIHLLHVNWAQQCIWYRNLQHAILLLLLSSFVQLHFFRIQRVLICRVFVFQFMTWQLWTTAILFCGQTITTAVRSKWMKPTALIFLSQVEHFISYIPFNTVNHLNSNEKPHLF